MQTEFVYLTAHSIRGILHQPSDPDQLIFAGTNPTIQVLLTSQPDRHLALLDRHTALAVMALRGMIGQPISEEFATNLAHEVDQIRNARAARTRNDALLLMEIRGTLDATITEPKREIDDYLLCFDAFDKQALREQLQPQVTAVLAALKLAGGRDATFEQLTDGAYLLAEGQIVHSFSPQFGAPTAYIASRLSDQQTNDIRNAINLLRDRNKFVRIIRLYVHALDRRTDNFRAFISTWAAMEMLVSKVFPTYQALLTAELTKTTAAPGLKRYLTRVADVMKDKLSLADKFAVISIFLDDAPGNEMDRFIAIKQVRDRLSHGEDVPESALPTNELRQLLEKYLRNHLQRVNEG